MKVEAGAIGFLVVVALCCATAGIFVLMSRSLKRVRTNVARGEFHGLENRSADQSAGGRSADRSADDRSADEREAVAPVPAQNARSARGTDPDSGV
ncbi:MAG: hypothetical protein ACQSGP_19085 [Frankia sp.]